MANPLPDQFPTSVAGIPMARAAEIVELADGDRFELRIAPVAKRLRDATVRMLAYNESIPGPTLKVREGSEVVVDVENRGDVEATVHWHGLRLENRYDGTHETQRPAAPGERFSARVTFPDPGVYWYHPHIREDYGQELGLEAEPDKVLHFLAEMDVGAPDGDGPSLYSCPMHPDMVSERTNHCPKCGMKLLPAALVADAATHGHDHGHHDHHDEGHAGAAADGIEWEDDMVEINRMTTPANMRWKLVDGETGAENQDIGWRFHVGDQVKIRLLNQMAGDHPMHHPFHVHGAARFLILARDGITEPNLAWKDTVLVRTGETVDILLDVSNVGRWMAHCHIAEHHETGMMFSFTVAPATSRGE